jgi:short subunit dehydrogenase-like uncharacterized protein
VLVTGTGDPVADRRYDVALLGATGFTGRLVAAELADRLAGTPTRWAIAGRSPDKLAAVADELDTRDGSATEPNRPDIEVVDVDDLVGLLDLTARTTVLATTVGPYARHGELVAQACVRSGTHYADITGEPAFVDLLRDRYDEDARERGVKLVSCCGFDSVPHDLGVRFTVAQLPDDVPLTVRGYVRGEGFFSGGTAASAIEAIASGVLPSGSGRIEAPGQRRAVGLPRRIHRVPELRAYGVPLPTIDPAIVLRSARVLPGYGSAFRYGHYARVRRLPTVVAGIGTVGVAAAMARFGPTRSVLRLVLPDSGDGPSEEVRARSRFDVTFIGHGAGVQVMTRVAGGDPGYDETAKMLAEAALSLLEDDGPDVAGVLTPAIGLGEPYHQRLVDRGLVFEVLDAGHHDGHHDGEDHHDRG